MGSKDQAMGNEPSNQTNDTAKREQDVPVATVVPGHPASAPPAYQVVEPCLGSTHSLQKADNPPPRSDIPPTALPVHFENPSKRDAYPKGILYQLGAEGGKCAYNNPHAARKCEVTTSTVDIGIKDALVDNCVGIFVTQDEPSSWFQVSLRVTYRVYPEHYVIGGNETAHRDDMPQSWVLEASNDEQKWDVLSAHQMDPSFVDADRSCGPKGWRCFPLPSAGPYRYFRVRHTGTTIGGSRAMAFSGFELFGYLVADDGL